MALDFRSLRTSYAKSRLCCATYSGLSFSKKACSCTYSPGKLLAWEAIAATFFRAIASTFRYPLTDSRIPPLFALTEKGACHGYANRSGWLTFGNLRWRFDGQRLRHGNVVYDRVLISKAQLCAWSSPDDLQYGNFEICSIFEYDNTGFIQTSSKFYACADGVHNNNI